jgi:hypothetical protein
MLKTGELMNLKTKKLFGWTAIIIIILMLLFPPWKVEVGKRKVEVGRRNPYHERVYTPSNIVSGQYGVLFNPPKNAKSVDVGRLTLQFLLVGAMGAGIIIMDRLKK